MIECPCGSGKRYTTCCGVYLDSGKVPETAIDLMRSRYTAYTRRDTAYLLHTWHPGTRPAPPGFHLPEDTIWEGLDIMATEAGGPGDEQGTVEFAARFVRQGRSGCLREKSRFVRLDGHWLYVDGDVRTDGPAPTVKTGRNDPCPCGSGRKYKKCCL